VLIAITFPLISIGATSAKYRGTIYAATPTPKPTRTLPAISTAIVGANAIVNAPIVNKTSANIMSFLRPSLSEAVPEKRDPTAAPASARLTISDLC
jgi:hypothetical protein